jgi:hypothetical protein
MSRMEFPQGRRGGFTDSHFCCKIEMQFYNKDVNKNHEEAAHREALEVAGALLLTLWSKRRGQDHFA